MMQTDRTQVRSVRDADGDLAPSRLDDPVAMEADWSPMPYESTRPYRLGISVERLDRIELAAAWPVKVLCLVLTAFGLALAAWAAIAPVSPEFKDSMVVLLAVGCMAAGAGITCLSGVMRSFILDKTAGKFGRGRIIGGLPGPQGQEIGMPIERVHAIQLLSEGSEHSSLLAFDVTYQLNLVLNDGTRVHLLRSRKEEAVVSMAGAIGQFLEKPVWDARY